MQHMGAKMGWGLLVVTVLALFVSLKFWLLQVSGEVLLAIVATLIVGGIIAKRWD